MPLKNIQLPLATWLTIDDAADADAVDAAAADIMLPLRDDRSGDSTATGTHIVDDTAAAVEDSAATAAADADDDKSKAASAVAAALTSFFWLLATPPLAPARAEVIREEGSEAFLRTVEATGGMMTETCFEGVE